MKSREPIGFTLLEVLIAMAVFFLAIFSLLELTSRSLRAARSLQAGGPHAGIVAAQLSASTNKLEEGMESGDFGEDYPGYSWQQRITTAGSNGLFQADFWVYRGKGNRAADPDLSILLYRPDSGFGPARGFGGRR